MAAPRQRAADPAERVRRDQRRAELLQTARARLSAELAAVTSTEDWLRLLDAVRRLDPADWRNAVLVDAQHPGAALVAGYDAWQTTGRQVTKGQKGLLVIAADPRRPDDPAAERATYVWDVTQTSGPGPLPQPAPPDPVAALLDPLTAAASRLGWTVTRGRTHAGDCAADPTARTVTVAAGLDDDQATVAVAHGLGHAVLHAAGPVDEPCAGLRRAEADAVAYLLTGRTTRRIPAPANWPGAARSLLLTHTTDRVAAAARGLRPARSQPPEHVEQARAVAVRAAAGAARTSDLRARATIPATPTPARPSQEDETGLDRLRAAHTAAAAFYRDQLTGPAGAAARAYLLGRGGAAVLADPRWALGYAPASWTALVDHLRGLGYTDDELLTGGLATRARTGRLVDVFRDRLTFGVHDPAGHLVGFLARAGPNAGDRVQRYLNTAETPLYRKGEVLFGLYEQAPAVAAARPLLLVEGAFDVLAVAAAGHTRPGHETVAVTPSGTALTRTQADIINRTVGPDRPITAGFDADAAGRRAAVRAWTVLAGDDHPGRGGAHRDLTRLVLPAGADPSDVLARGGPTGLQRLLDDPAAHAPLVELVLDHRLEPWAGQLDRIEARVTAARAVAPLIAAQPADKIGRLVTRTAARLDLMATTVVDLVADAAGAARTDAPDRPTARHRHPDPVRAGPVPSPALHRAAFPTPPGRPADAAVPTPAVPGAAGAPRARPRTR